MAGKSMKVLYKDRLWTRLELARAHGFAYQTLCTRLHSGMTVEQALIPPKPPIKPIVRYDVRGESLTVQEIVAKYDVSYFAIRSRLRRGMSMEEAVFFTPKGNRMLIPFRGEQVTFNHLAALSGLTMSTIRARIRRGVPPEEAIRSTYDLYGNRRGRLITHDGKTLNLAQWAKILGVTRERVRQRLQRADKLGLPVSSALIPRVTK